MYAKFEITGVINVITGMHIGGATQFSAIGSVDAPVIRDALTGLPIIPGSSLKGKMRYLLARKLNEYPDDDYDDYNHNDDHVLILRLFGSSKKGEIRKSRLLFSDTILNNAEELRRRGALSPTEIKIENSIHPNESRSESEANRARYSGQFF
jgi:CRISPR-associated protein Csm3